MVRRKKRVANIAHLTEAIDSVSPFASASQRSR
jgi:hypothetical protein